MSSVIDCLFVAIFCAFLVLVAQAMEKKDGDDDKKKPKEVKDDPNTDDTFPY